jgi:RecB family exonuclease
MDKHHSPAALADRIAARQESLAANASSLIEETRPAALRRRAKTSIGHEASQARTALHAQFDALAKDDDGRLTVKAIAAMAGSGLLVVLAIVRLAKH